MTYLTPILKHTKRLVQYAFCSLASAIVDVATYGILVKWVLQSLPFGQRIFWAAVIARIISSVVNYGCNRQLPYMQNKNIRSTAIRYYILWSFQLIVSFMGVFALCVITPLDEFTVKFIIDIALAIASYQIQLRWVFRKESPSIIRTNKILCEEV